MCGGGGGSTSVKPTAAENAQAQVAIKQYNLSRELNYVRDQYKSAVDQLDSDGTKGMIAGRANLMAQKAGGAQERAVFQQLASAGIDPSSGRGQTAMAAASNATGSAVGRSQGESLFALKTAALNGRSNVIAQALGKSADASTGLSSVADNAGKLAAANAQEAFNSHAATTSAIGTAAGLGLSAYNNREDS